MKKSIISLLVMSMSLSMLLSGCGASKSGKSLDNAKGIVFGAVHAMSGTSSSLGKATKQGMDLAIKEINAAGGIMGVPVSAVYRDDEGDPTKSRTYEEELITNAKVDFIIGPPNSTCVASSEAFINQNKKIQILNIATGTKLIDPKLYPYTFRIMTPNNAQAEALVKIAIAEGYKKIVLVHDTSVLGTNGLADMNKYMDLEGKKSVADISYTANEVDMTPVAQKIKDAGADCALFWTLGADGAKIVKALDRIGYIENMQILGYTGLAMTNFKELAGPQASRCRTLGIDVWAPVAGEKLAATTDTLYKKILAEYGEYGPGKRDTNPQTISSGYDSVMLIKWAIETAKSLDPDKIKAALESGKEIPGYYASKYTFTGEKHEGLDWKEICPIDLVNRYNGELAYKVLKK